MTDNTREKARERMQAWREAAREAEADHHELTKIRNRILSGSANREEIFLAVNRAATKMLVFSTMAATVADMCAVLSGLREEVSTPPATKAKNQAPSTAESTHRAKQQKKTGTALRLITGGKYHQAV